MLQMAELQTASRVEQSCALDSRKGKGTAVVMLIVRDIIAANVTSVLMAGVRIFASVISSSLQCHNHPQHVHHADDGNDNHADD